MTATRNPASPCPCGTGRSYPDCCGRYHCGKAVPQTAEQLMRSRYAAYALCQVDYLCRTTHPERRNSSLHGEISAWAAQVEFTGLKILAVYQGQTDDKRGKVEFIADYRHRQQAAQLHELSRFRRYQGEWVYFDGEIR